MELADLIKKTAHQWEIQAARDKALREMEVRTRPLYDVIDAVLSLLPDTRVFVTDPFSEGIYHTILDVQVKDFLDVMPVLELIEKALRKAGETSYEFNATSDSPGSGWRSFIIRGFPWLRVDACLPSGGGERCKAVIVGYESVPKYEFKCNGQEGSNVNTEGGIDG